jgi:hypothetical protein
MSVNLSPLGGAGAQFFTNDGVPLSGGLLYTYQAGTTTPATTYTSGSGITALANPIILDAAGRVPTGEIWLTDGVSYKFVLKDSTDVLIATWDGLSGINSNFIAYTSLEETATATAGQTVFNLSIDYSVGTNNLAVFVNGSNQIVNVNYLETDTNTVTFLTGLNVGDVVKFSTATPIATNAMDASNVSYTPAGVGAVTTNVQTKLRETVTVTDFGAVGDGVTDDTAAIQAAIDSAVIQNKAVYVPNGAYLISATISIPNNMALIGETPRKINSGGNTYGVYFTPASNITMFETTTQSGNSFGITIQNISIFAPSVGTGSTGFILGSPTDGDLLFGLNIDSVSIQGIANGIKIFGHAPNTVLSNITMAGNDTANSYGLSIENGQVCQATALKIENFYNCYEIINGGGLNLFSSSAAHNVPSLINSNNLVYIKDSKNCNFYSCVFENLSTSSGSNMVDILIESISGTTNNSVANRFYNCIWNGIGSTKYHVQIGTTAGETVNDTTFYSCRFKIDPSYVTANIFFQNAENTVIYDSYNFTGYDGYSTGTPSFAGTDVGLRIYNADGIRFPSTAIKSTNVNTLDVYEEGTFTPILQLGGATTGITYVSQEGYYTRVGNVVSFQLRFVLSSKGSATGNASIIGLPYNIRGNALSEFAFAAMGSGLSSSLGSGVIIRGQAQTTILQVYYPTSGTIAFITDSLLTNSANFSVTGSYITSA